MAHKLPKELRKGLTLLADVLPETTENFRQKVTGAQLLQENITRLPGGQAIEAKRLYSRSAQRRVNHKHRLHGAYTNAGRAGVLDYCRPHIEPEHFAAFSAKLSELVPL